MNYKKLYKINFLVWMLVSVAAETSAQNIAGDLLGYVAPPARRIASIEFDALPLIYHVQSIGYAYQFSRSKITASTFVPQFLFSPKNKFEKITGYLAQLGYFMDESPSSYFVSLQLGFTFIEQKLPSTESNSKVIYDVIPTLGYLWQPLDNSCFFIVSTAGIDFNFGKNISRENIHTKIKYSLSIGYKIYGGEVN